MSYDLPPGQLRVLATVADALFRGEGQADAANSLGLAEGTVKNHLALARAALGAASTIHAIALLDEYRPGWRSMTRPLAIPARSPEAEPCRL